MKNQQLRQKIEQLFGFPAMKMPWTLYLAQLNEAGKLTARSNMDMMTVILEVLEVMEEDIKDTKLLIESQSLQTVSVGTAEPIKVELPIEEKIPETTGEILDAIQPDKINETIKKVHEVTEKVVCKGIVDAILEG